MAAHPCVDARGRWWNVAVKFGRTCEYVLFRSAVDGVREVVARIPVARPGYLHAFALTQRHALIWDCALRAHPLRFLFAGESYIEHYDWLPAQGSKVHAVSLADGSVRSWDAPPLMVFHAPQAFEHGDELVLDLCVVPAAFAADDPGLRRLFDIESLRRGGLRGDWLAEHTRLVLARGASSARVEALPGRFDLPQVHPELALRGPVQHVFGATVDERTPGEFFNQVLRLDHRGGTLQRWGRERALSLEPLFVPRPGGTLDDDGVLLVPTLADDDPGTVIAVLDAATLGELARIELPHVVPFGFHAAWQAAG
jgi:carotenoid cleavage dioxygenase-like enzyme